MKNSKLIQNKAYQRKGITNKTEHVKTEKKTEISYRDNYTKFFPFIIFSFAFLLYINTLNHEYALDDLIVTTDNPLVKKGISGIPEIVSHGYFYGNTKRNDQSYRPLSLVIIAIETEIWGLNPKVFHFFNVLYYALTCLLLYILLKRVFQNYKPVIAFIITLIFTAHPIHTEVVANIKSRDEILHLLFMVSSLIFLFKYLDRKKIQFLLISLLTYFFALLSKENAITFLAVIPLMIYYFTNEKIRTNTIISVFFIIAGALYLILRISILDTLTIKEPIDTFANALMAAKTFGEFLATNFWIHLKYIALLIFPHPLSWDYSVNQIPIISLLSLKSIFSVLILLSLAVYGLASLKNKNIIGFGILFYFVTLSVVSNFIVRIEWTMGERFLFTPSIGFCISVVFAVISLAKYFKIEKQLAGYSSFLVIFLLIAYSVKTITRNRDWKNSETMFASGVLTAPNSARTHMCMGDEYRKKASEEKDALIAQQYINKAIAEFETAISIFSENSQIYYSYGYMLYNLGKKDEALKIFENGLKAKNNDKDVLNYCGIIYTERGNLDTGLYFFKKILSIDSTYSHAYNNLGYIAANKKDTVNALKYFEKALYHNQMYKSAYISAGVLYFQSGDYLKSAEKFEKLLELEPANKTALQNLVLAYKQLQNNEKVAEYQQKLNNIK